MLVENRQHRVEARVVPANAQCPSLASKARGKKKPTEEPADAHTDAPVEKAMSGKTAGGKLLLMPPSFAPGVDVLAKVEYLRAEFVGACPGW